MRPEAYEYTNKRGVKYFLHSREVTLRVTGKIQRIFYFGKSVNEKTALAQVPTGYIVVENVRTGLPLLKKA